MENTLDDLNFDLSLESTQPDLKAEPQGNGENVTVIRGLNADDWERLIKLMVEAKEAAEAAKTKVSVIYRYNEDTDEYEGAAGRFYKALNTELRDNQDKFGHVWQYAKALNPTELYKWLSGQLTTFLNGAVSTKLAEIDQAYAAEIAEMKRMNDAALRENSRLVGDYRQKYDQIAGGFTALKNKVDSAVSTQNADIQEAKRTIQATANDLGSLLSQSMKETAYFKRISEQLMVAVFFAIAILGLATGLLFFRSPDSATPEVQADFVKKYVQDVDSLETIIKENGYKKKVRKY
jgi:hypothetical protein